MSPEQERAAALFAGGGKTWEEISELVGVSRMTLSRWRHLPEFATVVDRRRREVREAVRTSLVGDKLQRIRILDLHYRRIKIILKERGEDMRGVPGGRTGFLVRTLKKVGEKVILLPEQGRDKQGRFTAGPTTAIVDNIVEEYAFDGELSRELREVLKQAGQEVGDYNEPLPADATEDGAADDEQVSLAEILTPDELDEVMQRLRARQQQKAKDASSPDNVDPQNQPGPAAPAP